MSRCGECKYYRTQCRGFSNSNSASCMDFEPIEIEELAIDQIRLEQYKNLRDNFEKYLVKPILGDKYYNCGQDVYTCDQIKCKDIKLKYESKCKEAKKYKIYWLVTFGYFIAYVIISLFLL